MYCPIFWTEPQSTVLCKDKFKLWHNVLLSVCQHQLRSWSICADAEQQTTSTDNMNRSHCQLDQIDVLTLHCPSTPFGALSTAGAAFSVTAAKSDILSSLTLFEVSEQAFSCKGAPSCASPELRKEDPVF